MHRVRVPPPAPRTASAGPSAASLPDSYTANVTASVTTAIAAPNVLITKHSSGTNFVPGQSFTYTVTAFNAGSGSASGVVVSDPIPSGLILINNGVSTMS